MAVTLQGVEAKIARAQKHLDLLEGERRKWGKPHSDSAWATVVQFDHNAGKCEFVWRQHKPTPIEWSVILGEFLYDLRSAMDHVARQLVIANGRKPTGRSEFPIFKDPGDFEGRSCPKTQGMHAEVKRVMEEMQPFRVLPENPTATTPWLIHDLCNKDKHRLLNVTGPWLIGGYVEWKDVPEGVISPVKEPGRMRLYDKALMASYEWSPTVMRRIVYTKPNADFGFVVDVAIGEGKWIGKKEVLDFMPMLDFMSKCLKYMNETFVPTLAPFLEDAAHNDGSS